MSVLTVRDLTVEIAGRRIVDRVSFDVRAGDKVGLVGRNGAGKTSLFRALGGGTTVDGGAVTCPTATGYLSQEPRDDRVPGDLPCLAHVLSGRGLDELATELDKLTVDMEADPSMENIERFSAVQERFEQLGGYAAEAEVHRLSAGLGLAPDRLALTVGALSGGERRRLDLARILFGGSELLLLDEPTNHLDADARDWLLRFLRDYGGALLVVSHDLDLLDESITRILHLDRDGEDDLGELVDYPGTYTHYLAAREDQQAQQAKLAERRASEIQRLSRRADSMRGQTAKRARVAKNLDVRAERLRKDQVEGPAARRELSIRLPDPPPAGRTVIEVDGLAKSYGVEPVLDGVDVVVGRGERVLVMGANGAGKTTLLKLLAGRLRPDRGRISYGHGVQLGYFAQEHDSIVDGRSLLDHLRSSSPLGDDVLRGVLGMFGLRGDKAFQGATTLSGGEKTRLALAQLVAGGHNVLLLDEPTNHLDPASRSAVGEALARWPGALVVVSHDVEFVESLRPDRVLHLPEGHLDYFEPGTAGLVEVR